MPKPISASLPENLIDDLADYCTKTGLSKSDIIRTLLKALVTDESIAINTTGANPQVVCFSETTEAASETKEPKEVSEEFKTSLGLLVSEVQSCAMDEFVNNHERVTVELLSSVPLDDLSFIVANLANVTELPDNMKTAEPNDTAVSNLLNSISHKLD